MMKTFKDLDNKIKICICIGLAIVIGVFVYFNNPVNKVNLLISTHSYQKVVTYYNNNKFNLSQHKKIRESIFYSKCFMGYLYF